MNRAVSDREEKLKVVLYRLLTFISMTAILTPFLNAISTRYVPGDSDGATVILEGLAMARGNWLLHGWSISLDSFWTLDALFNAFLIKIVGFGPSLLTLTPSFIAAMTISAGVLMAYRPGKKLAGLLGPLIVVMCLALPAPDLSYYLLQGPWHVVTVLYCLAAFALLGKRQSWPAAALAALILAVALLGDILLLDFGISAIVVGGVVAMLRSRKFSTGIKTVLSGLLSIPLAIGLRLLADTFGTFEIVNRNLPLKLSQIEANVGYIPGRIAAMFGVGSVSSAPTNADFILEVMRATMLFVVCATVLFSLGNTIVAMFRGNKGAYNADPKEWHFNDMLLLGIFADFVTFIVGATSNNSQYSKYLDPAIIFAAILTARVLSYVFTTFLEARRESGAASYAISSGPATRMPGLQSAYRSQSPISPAVGLFTTPGAETSFYDVSLGASDGYGRERDHGIAFPETTQGPVHLSKEAADPYLLQNKGKGKSFFEKKLFAKGFFTAVLFVSVCSLIAGGVQVKNELALPVASQPIRGLVSFLESKGLYNGVGAYWVSSIVTVESKGEVTIRPVTNAAADKLRRYGRQSAKDWYADHEFQFFIYNLYQPWRKVNTLSAVKTYGVPKTQITDGPYRIIMWQNPISVSLVLPTISNPLDIILR